MLNAWWVTGDAEAVAGLDGAIGGSSGGVAGGGGGGATSTGAAAGVATADSTAAARAAAPEKTGSTGGDLDRRERPQAHPERDALAKLSERRVGELRLELGLPGEEDLEYLLACRLEVREQAKLLEDVLIEVLGLVDQQGDVAAGARVLDQEVVQAVETAELARSVGRDAELDQDVLEDLVEADRRVHEENRADARVERVEQVAEEGGLPGACLA